MSTVLDAEPVVLEELDLTPTCDWTGPTCPAVATWEAVAKECGCAWLACDHHADETERRMKLPFVTIVCADCGTPLSRIEFRPVPR